MLRPHLLLLLAVAALVASVALVRDEPASAGVAVPAQLDLGLRFSCARVLSGEVFCWGENHVGQLGDGTTADRAKPGPVLGLGGNVTAIAAGGLHTCALLEDTGAQCWGWNRYGQLGNGTQTPPSFANPVPSDVLLTPPPSSTRLTNIAAIEAGGVHTCALMGTGGLKCWGWNAYGQIGGACGSVCLPPTNVTGLTSGVAAVGLGDNHSCAVTASGGVKCWGLNDVGQLGAATTQTCGIPPVPCSTTPIDVPGLTSIVDVAAGNNHTCALTTTGDVKCWGDNSSGQLGDGQACGTTCSSPVDVTGLSSGAFAIAAGGSHTCALTYELSASTPKTMGAVTFRVECWGDNSGGQLGDGQTCGTTCAAPVVVTGLSSGVIAIAAGGDHTCALTGSGAVLCWGANDHGQVGDGSHTDRDVPVGVLGLAKPPDSDRDGCTNDQELGPNAAQGGLRDPNRFWDFFDTPDANNIRDSIIAVGDIFRVVDRFGATGAPDNPLTPPPASGYHSAFDRSPSAPGGDPWDLGGPDGAVGTNDILFAVLQFGHTCA